MANLALKMQQKTVENPFFNCTPLRDLRMILDRGSKSTVKQSFQHNLTNIYQKVKSNKEHAELFWILIFACGDIPNREHNLLRGAKIDQGGQGDRQLFMWAMEWAQTANKRQYEAFLTKDLIRQYSSLDTILANRVKTAVGKKAVIETISMLENVNIDVLSEYLAKIIRQAENNPVEAQIIAKFLANVKLGNRQKTDRKTGVKSGQRALQPATIANMKRRETLYIALSEKMGWEVKDGKFGKDFAGLRAWKARFNGNLESVLFSSGAAKDMDKTQFFTFLEQCPAGARYRVRRRLLDKNDAGKEKWIASKLGTWYLEWEKSKEKAQQEVRELKAKIESGTASVEESEQLAAKVKEAKVNTGGTTLYKLLTDFLTGGSKDADLMIDQILNKINFQVPCLVIGDYSASMSSRSSDGVRADVAAAFLATISMLKNPSPELSNLLVRFASDAEFISDHSTVDVKTNRFLQTTTAKHARLVDKTRPFGENFDKMKAILSASGGGTNFSSVSGALVQWLNTDPATKQARIEELLGYPVILVVSDGDMNSDNSAQASMLRFQREMQSFGWNGVIVVWDVCTGTLNNSKFANLENVMHFMGWNLSIIQQVFEKIHDLDVIDIDLPLKAMYESNRYAPVKAAVL